ncbi:ribosome biogenesis protein SLX9 homolog [Hetaerina americana]|uniref:ribosome biogenesis protein SLX9 homolog n=1 Tax=Hetaerina americana TaxID=62018 RepID=UPI003A7F2D7C
MGRLKRERRKFHLKAVGAKDNGATSARSTLNVNEDSKLPLPTISDTLFSGISISLDEIKLPSEETDKKSVLSWKSFKSEFSLPKKLKHKTRHEAFLKKLNAFYNAEKDKKLTKKRQTTVITGDMKPLLDALPDFDVLSGSTDEKFGEKSRSEAKRRGTLKAKRRQNDLLANITAFKSVLQNPKFQENPMEMVSKNIFHQLTVMSEDIQ